MVSIGPRLRSPFGYYGAIAASSRPRVHPRLSLSKTLRACLLGPREGAGVSKGNLKHGVDARNQGYLWNRKMKSEFP